MSKKQEDNIDLQVLELIGIGILFFIIGAVWGLNYNYFPNTSSKVVTPPTYYEGMVQAIYSSNQSYVKFTSGQYEYGNLSMIDNLSINADCKLLINTSIIAIASETPSSGTFINGVCK